jgi:dihydroneopterin aldolase
MSTSLDIQTIDSKFEIVAAEQTSSQRTNIGHLDKIQEGVQAVATLQKTACSAALDISRSTDRIHETLQYIQASQAASQLFSNQQAEKIDAVVSAIQRSLLNAPVKEQRTPRTRQNARKTSFCRRNVVDVEEKEEQSMPGIFSELVQRTVNPSTIPVQINRLVDLAVTVRYRCGKAQFRAVAVPDPEFDAADFETKLRMVKYLQDLRLLLWLLCRKEYVVSRDHVFHCLPQSSLIPDANLDSAWTFWRTINLLSIGVAAPRNLPKREKQYLKYVIAQCEEIPRKRLILEWKRTVAYWFCLCFDCTVGAIMRLEDLFPNRGSTAHWLIQP